MDAKLLAIIAALMLTTTGLQMAFLPYPKATDRMAASLARGGLVVCYGAVSRSPAELSVLQTVFRGIRMRGFWLYPWKRRDMERTRQWLRELIEDFEASRLITEVAAELPLERWQEAFELAASSERNGRVVLCPVT